MVLVRFGWIHTKFCSFALVVWHRLQQRKLILAKNETHKKNKNTIKTQNRQKQPDKIHQKNTKSKNKSHKNNLDKFWLFCVFLVCFFLCALVLYFFNRYILYAVRLKSLVYKKDQNKLLTVIFGSREKEESKIYERKGGQAHPSLEYIFWISGFDIWLDFRHGWTYGWIWLDIHTIIHHPIKSFCMSLYTNKYYLKDLTYFFGTNEKESSKMYEWGGTGSPLLGIHFWVNYDWMWSWLDLVGYTQNSVHLPL